jgi:hypothetical protein
MILLRHVLVLCLFALYGIAAVSAAGNGTFSIPAIPGVNVGDNLTATVYLDNTWSPKAADVYLHVRYDSSLLAYTGTDFKVGNTVAATPDAGNSILLQFGDFTNGYPNGRIPIADLKFNATGAGVSPLTLSVDHVRYYVNDTPVDIGDTAAVISGTVTIGVVTNITPTVIPTVTVPNTTVPTVVIPNNTTITPVQTAVTTTPEAQINYAGSNNYTGVVRSLATTALPTQAGGYVSVTVLPITTESATTAVNETATPAMNGTPSAATTTATPSQPASPTAGTTIPAGTSVPVSVATTTQAAGVNFGLLSLVSLGGVALLFIGRRLR